jgi:predicted nucleic acid-binding protein
MAVKVVDASALAAVLFGEPDAERVVEELRDCSLVAPLLLRSEIASVCRKKLRRHPARRADLLAGFGMMAQMGIAEAAVDLSAVLALSERKRLTVYDDAYLWLAERLGVDLVTLDTRLAAAVRA